MTITNDLFDEFTLIRTTSSPNAFGIRTKEERIEHIPCQLTGARHIYRNSLGETVTSDHEIFTEHEVKPVDRVDIDGKIYEVRDVSIWKDDGQLVAYQVIV